MQKLISSVIVLLLTSSALAAGSLNMDLRSDYLAQTWSSDAVRDTSALNSVRDNNKFYLQTGRIDYKGSLNEDTSFRLRLRFAGKDQGVVSKRDSTNSTLDFAYVTQKVSDLFALTVGKLNSDLGGYEGLTTNADLYLISEAFQGTKYFGGYGATTGYLGGHSSEFYLTGLKGTITLGDHEIQLLTANSDTNVGRNQSTTPGAGDVTKGGFDQQRLLTGILYRGNFADKVLGVLASYHSESVGDNDTKAEFAAVGLQYVANGLMVQLDDLMDTYKSSSTVTDKMNSWVLSLKYNIDTLTPMLKFISSEETLDGSTAVKNKYTSYGAGLEWKPKKEDPFRYHIAYNNRSMKPDTGSDRNLQEVLLGMRIYGDFLK